MTVKAQSVQLKGGELIDEEVPLKVSRWALLRAENNINKLPTWEIGRRIYARHAKGLWQTAAITTWVILTYKVIW